MAVVRFGWCFVSLHFHICSGDHTKRATLVIGVRIALCLEYHCLIQSAQAQFLVPEFL